MRSAVRKMGNSSGLIIPKQILAESGLQVGDDVEIAAERGRLTIVPLRQGGRAGWSEDARRLTESGDEGLVWPEFGNEDDQALTW